MPAAGNATRGIPVLQRNDLAGQSLGQQVTEVLALPAGFTFHKRFGSSVKILYEGKEIPKGDQKDQKPAEDPKPDAPPKPQPPQK